MLKERMLAFKGWMLCKMRAHSKGVEWRIKRGFQDKI